MAMEAKYDKLAGDADLVKTKGQEYADLGDAILEACAVLQAILDVEMCSEAIEATRETATSVKADIEKAADRYRATGDALVVYSEALATAIAASEGPAATIVTLTASLATARSTLWNRRQDLLDATRWYVETPEDEVEELQKAVTTAENQVTNLEAQIVTAQGQWQDAFDARADAALIAANKIKEVTEGKGANGLNDTFWDKASVVVEIIKMVCDIAAVLSIFLAWVPILGQVLLVLAAIGALIAIVDAAIKLKRGEGSWGDLALAVGMAALTLFGGKLIGAGAKYLKGNAANQVLLRNGPAAVNFHGKTHDALILFQSGKHATGGLALLKSPFVRSSAQSAIHSAYKAGTLSFGSAFRANLGNLLVNPFKLKTALKLNDELLDLGTIASRNWEFLDKGLKAKGIGLLLANVGVNLATFHKGLGSLEGAIGSGDGFGTFKGVVGIGSGHLDGLAGNSGRILNGGVSAGGLVDKIVDGVDLLK